eukprot:Blabericola_migrator_1__212@NODE_1056_length_5570_cov_147_169726_g726_i0_p2_GENE_NODE_1056_length_5570_cov_147_169726_g726_i0NODE_1056_length_5570_cov_147_169726_g726_i0_p2_ORF_typecomplete_len410_score74_18DMT_YdcZ/PF04657_13/2_1e15DMT_YdcZ/PF04657_13/4_2e17DUF5392/PF17370_2/0_068DUF5392/PF17370_2/5_8e03NMO/PF03060_15/0_62_NODE_1056_length_5570_cov_147_169726_g726_i0141243
MHKSSYGDELTEIDNAYPDIAPYDVELDSSYDVKLCNNPDDNRPTACQSNVSDTTEELPQQASPLWKQLMMYMFPFSLGLLIPVMTAMNTILQEEVGGNVFFMTAILYFLGTVIMAIYILFTSPMSLKENWYSLGDFLFIRPSVNAFCLAGGLAGVSQHILTAIVAASGGLGVFTLGTLIGSIATSILLDATGWFWAVKSHVGWLSYLGGLIVASGAVIHSLSAFLNSKAESVGTRTLALFLAALSGLLLCVQSCIMKKLSVVLGEFRRSVLWSYMSGCLILLLIAPYTSTPITLRTIILPKNWWKVTQIGITIYSNVVITHFQFKLNAAVVFCWVITGQLLSSTLIDAMGWMGLDQRPLTLFNIIGMCCVIVGIVALTYDKIREGHKIQLRPLAPDVAGLEETKTKGQ